MNVLIIDDIHAILLEKLGKAGVQCDYRPQISVEEASYLLARYEGLVLRSKCRVDATFLEHAAHLKFIARAGAGMDNIDEQLAKQKGITLINAPEGNRYAVAEHLVGMLLALMNHFRTAHQEIAQGKWLREKNRGLSLRGRTVALIGYGNNGQAMARCLSGFGVTCIAYDKYKTGFSDEFATEVSMEEVVKRADVLSFHIPLTKETRNLVDREYLFHFRKPILLLNGARGEVVNMEAVLEALRSGKILGAAFDVLPAERFPALSEQVWYNELISLPNVLLTPHVAGWTVESYYDIADVLAEKIISFQQGD